MKKNIHILATKQPSRLVKNNKDELKLTIQTLSYDDIIERYPQHIYITSDEEIKKGDWYLELKSKFNPKKLISDKWGDGQHFKTFNQEGYKKVILTTDPTLIADGVQAIEDTFLEWFIDNFKCEFVEVEKTYKNWYVSGTLAPDLKLIYKITIPTEELKQETRVVCKCKRAYINVLSGICTLCWNEKFPNEKDEIKEEDLLEPKQETLEKAASKYAEIHADVYEVKGELHFVNNVNKIEDAFTAGAKWQAEKMYSEEEVKDILIRSKYATYYSIVEWFEQNEKK